MARAVSPLPGVYVEEVPPELILDESMYAPRKKTSDSRRSITLPLTLAPAPAPTLPLALALSQTLTDNPNRLQVVLLRGEGRRARLRD